MVFQEIRNSNYIAEEAIDNNWYDDIEKETSDFEDYVILDPDSDSKDDKMTAVSLKYKNNIMAEAVRPIKSKTRKKESTSTLIHQLETLEVVSDDLIKDVSNNSDQIEDEEQPMSTIEGDQLLVHPLSETYTNLVIQASVEEVITTEIAHGDVRVIGTEIEETNSDNENVEPEQENMDIKSENVKTEPEQENMDTKSENDNTLTVGEEQDDDGFPDVTNETVRAAQQLYPSLEHEGSANVTDISVVDTSCDVVEEATAPMEEDLYPSLPGQLMQETQDVVLPAPLAQAQLKSLTYNEVLENLDDFEEDFIQTREIPHHDLHILLTNYQRSLSLLTQCREQIKSWVDDANRLRNNIWTLESHTGQGTALCKDNKLVTATYSFKTAHLNDKFKVELCDTLSQIRRGLEVELSSQAYEALLSRNMIDNYIYKLYQRSSLFKATLPNSPAQLTSVHHDGNAVKEFNEFHDCITVIFSFLRRPSYENEFTEALRGWTLYLGGSLLRIGRSQDHLFLLAHLLRCPPGIGQWGACLFQPVLLPPQLLSHSDASNEISGTFQTHIFKHTVASLSLLFRPVRDRLQFLGPMRSISTSLSTEDSMVFVDSDGEEDHLPREAWHRLTEADLLAFLAQVPLDTLFRHVVGLGVDLGGSGEQEYRALLGGYTTPGRLYRVFAFLDQLLGVIRRGLDTYSEVNYKHLGKRLNRMIKHCLQFLTDHTEVSMGLLVSAQTETEETLLKLQSQYETVVHTGIRHLLAGPSAQSRGVWETLADCPFRLLTSQAKRRVLALVVGGDVANNDDGIGRGPIPIPDVAMLEDWLPTLQADERIQLMTSLASLGHVCRLTVVQEVELLMTIVKGIFRISFLCENTRESCAKVGREVLSALALQHPMLLNMLLDVVKDNLDTLGKMALYLLRELPFHLFQPEESHLVLLSNWLINYPIKNLPNQLSRAVLSGLNWGFDQQDNSRLFLPVCIHRRMAVLIVKAFRVHNPPKQSGWMITEGLKMMASAVWKSSPSDEQSFHAWCLSLIVRLRLHLTQRAPLLYNHPSRDPDDTNIVLTPKHEFVFEGDELGWREVREEGISGLNPVATYTVLAASELGHRFEGMFLFSGLDLLTSLCSTQQQYGLTIEAVSQVVRLFCNHDQRLIDTPSFMALIRSLIHGDENTSRFSHFLGRKEFPGQILNTFTMMVLQLCEPADQYPAMVTQSMRQFWLNCLLAQPDWFKDRDVLFTLDRVLALNFRMTSSDYQDIGAYAVFTAVKSYTEQVSASWETRTGLSTLLPLSTGSYLPSLALNLLSSSTIPRDHSNWVLFYLLVAEMRYEDLAGLWVELQNILERQFCTGGKDAVDVATALKEAEVALAFKMSYSQERLSIYILLKAITNLSPGHPTLPLITQLFFQRFFSLPKTTNSPTNSTGLHAFNSKQHNSQLKDLRRSLSSTSDFFHERYTQALSQSSSTIHSIGGPTATQRDVLGQRELAFYRMMARSYETFVMWVDEPRLHSTILDLVSLPLQYCANRLAAARCANKDWWVDLMDLKAIDGSLYKQAKAWRRRHDTNRTIHRPFDFATIHNRVSVQNRMLDRINRQLKSIAPPMTPPLKSLIQDIDSSALCDQRILFFTIRPFLDIVDQHAKTFNLQRQHQFKLDTLLECLLPKLYNNVLTQSHLTKTCTANSIMLPGYLTANCAGEAHILVTHEAAKEVEEIRLKILDNRQQHNQLLLQGTTSPSNDVIRSVLQLEHVITCLVQEFREERNPQQVRQCAVALFYHFLDHLTSETLPYPPYRQLIEQCTALLGKNFIQPFGSEIENLLSAILDSPDFVHLLAPHLQPMNAPELFIDLYGRVVKIPRSHSLSVAEEVLIKFDLTVWLDYTKPSLQLRKKLLVILCKSLTFFKTSQKADTQKLLQIYINHLKAMVSFQFPELFSPAIFSLFECVFNGCEVPVKTWSVIIHVMEGDIDSNKELSLSIEQLSEILNELSGSFHNQRNQSQDLTSRGLYIVWNQHTQSLAKMIGLLLIGLVNKVARSTNSEPLRRLDGIDLTMRLVCSTLGPWLEPYALSTPCQFGAPWTSLHAADAEHMLSVLREVLMAAHHSFRVANNEEGCSVLPRVWAWYSGPLARTGLSSSILVPYHHHLTQLPWQAWTPSTTALYSMQEFYNRQSFQGCREFLASVMSFINWNHNSPTIRRPDSQIDYAYQNALYKLSVGLVSSKELIKYPACEILVDHLCNLSWTGLDAGSYKVAVDWLLTRAPVWIVLADRFSMEGKLMRLVAAGGSMYRHGDQDSRIKPDENMYRKQVIFVRTAMTLLAQCGVSNKPEVARTDNRFSTCLINLISQVEATINEVPPSRERNTHSLKLAHECLVIIQNTSEESRHVAMTTLLSWIEDSGSSPLVLPLLGAAGACLHNGQAAAFIIEKVAYAYITSVVSSGSPADWSILVGYLNIDQRLANDFIKESLQSGLLLCLYLRSSQLVTRASSNEDRVQLTGNLREWVTSVAIKDSSAERAFILWDRLFDLIGQESSQPERRTSVMRHLNALIPMWTSLSEDRTSTGILGYVGLGTRSNYSVSFRIIARALATFCLAQLPTGSNLRLSPTCPGHLTSKTAVPERPPGHVLPTNQALQAIASFKTLSERSDYSASQREAVNHCLDFLDRPENALPQIRQLLNDLIKRLYPDLKLLAILRQS